MASSKLFVGNLPWTATEEEIRNLFGDADVAEVKIINDRETGRSKGFGFVTMINVEAAEAAARRLDGSTLGGRELRVNEANERERRPSNGSGYDRQPPQEDRGGRGGRGGRQRRGRRDDGGGDW